MSDREEEAEGEDPRARLARHYGHVPAELRETFSSRIDAILDWTRRNEQSWLSAFVDQRLASGNIPDPRVAIVAAMAEAKEGGAGDGVVLVGGSGDVMFVDQAARELLDRRVWLEDKDGVLTGVVPAFDNGLRALIEEVLQLGRGERCLRLDALGSGLPLFVRAGLLRLPEAGQQAAPFVILHLRPEEAPLDLDQQCLGAWYGMTDAEARLAVAFASGMSLAEYGEVNAVSINTVRTLFARLKAKLDAPDQAAVVRKVLIAALRR